MKVYAAGGLRAALTEVAQAFEQEHAVALRMTFDASGLLMDRILAGEAPHFFASGNMENLQALAAVGKAANVAAFARNTMCMLAAPTFSRKGKTLAFNPLQQRLSGEAQTPRPAGPGVPEAINVSARYGLALLNPVQPAAQFYCAVPDGPARPGDRVLSRLRLAVTS